MNKQTKKYVINQQVLENFDKITQEQSFLTEDVLLEKPLRDPQANKQRDQRKLSKRDRWDD